jgi:N,N-dimethylformamidase beta subunit-like protein
MPEQQRTSIPDRFHPHVAAERAATPDDYALVGRSDPRPLGGHASGVTLARLALCAVLAFSWSLVGSPARPAAAAGNAIEVENQQQGTQAWIWGPKISDDAAGQIKGYASATSVAQGQSINLFVSVNPAGTYSMDFFRLGWYAGMGGRLRRHVDLNGGQQAACVPDATTGLTACGWTPSYTLTVPTDWTSGVYFVKLQNSQGYQNYIVFVVRDGRPAPFLYQQSVVTAQAYNNYPDDGRTGKSLYGFNSWGPNTVFGDPRAVKVSFDRPFTGYGIPQFDEIGVIRWLERSGYDVTYSTNIDTHANGAALRNHKALLSVAHDEYWSKEMRDALESARDAGVSLAFFSANAGYHQVRFESSAEGVPHRVVVAYRNAAIDPVQGPTTTVLFRDPPVNRPEQSLVGVMYSSDAPQGRNTGFVATNTSHWAYAGTGLRDGDVVPGIVGYEIDRFFPNFPPPAARSRVLLSDSPFTPGSGGSDRSNSSLYQAPSGAWVFASGTISWNWGLEGFLHGTEDARVQRITANVFDAFVNGAPVVDHLKVVAPATATAGQQFVVDVRAEDSRGRTVTGYDGMVHFATSDTSPGVLLPPDTTLPGGQGAFTLTLGTSGPQTVTVSDAENSLSTTVTVNVTAPATGRLVLETTATPIAGLAFNFTVSAKDSAGSPDPTYSGTVHFTTTDTSAGVILPPDSTLTNGQGTFSATLIQTGPQTITGTDTVTASIAGALTVTVSRAASSSLAVVTTAIPSAGEAFTFTVTAQDQFGNTDPSYAGTLHFTSSDTSAGVLLPADTTLTNGVGTFSGTLIKVGAQSITVTDTVTPSITGSMAVVVRAGKATTVALATTATPTAGTAFTFTATAKDQFGNTDTSYAGTLHFTSSDTAPGVVLPGNATLTNGQRTFSATLVRAGAQSITATDTVTASITGSVSVTVRAAAAATATVNVPAETNAGASFGLTVTMRDRFGNVATGYTGTIHFTTSDWSPLVSLPGNYRFTAADAGVRNFSATLWTPGPQTITVTDTANSAVTGTSPAINVKLVGIGL